MAAQVKIIQFPGLYNDAARAKIEQQIASLIDQGWRIVAAGGHDSQGGFIVLQKD